jgi:hypothetical protein
VTSTQSVSGGGAQEMGAWLSPPSMSHYRENLLEHALVSTTGCRSPIPRCLL